MAETYHFNANPASDTPLGAIPTLISMAPRPSSAETIAANVRLLMNHHGLSQNELGKLAGVAQTMLSGLLSSGAGPKNPTCSTIDKLAAYFRVAPWQLMVRGMTLDLLLSGDLADVVEAYASAPPAGRESIKRIAEAEVRYAAAVEAPAKKASSQ